MCANRMAWSTWPSRFGQGACSGDEPQKYQLRNKTADRKHNLLMVPDLFLPQLILVVERQKTSTAGETKTNSKWISSSQRYCVTTKCKHHSVFLFCATRIWFAGMTAGNECRLFFESTTQQICQHLLKRMALCMTFLVVNRLFKKWANVAN